MTLEMIRSRKATMQGCFEDVCKYRDVHTWIYALSLLKLSANFYMLKNSKTKGMSHRELGWVI